MPWLATSADRKIQGHGSNMHRRCIFPQFSSVIKLAVCRNRNDAHIPEQKETPLTFVRGVLLCVGTYLLFRAASSQVSSARVSLTAVFGMGTGVPSPSSAPTIRGSFSEPSELNKDNIEKNWKEPAAGRGASSPLPRQKCVRYICSNL